jgi:hypothetical protein
VFPGAQKIAQPLLQVSDDCQPLARVQIDKGHVSGSGFAVHGLPQKRKSIAAMIGVIVR